MRHVLPKSSLAMDYNGNGLNSPNAEKEKRACISNACMPCRKRKSKVSHQLTRNRACKSSRMNQCANPSLKNGVVPKSEQTSWGIPRPRAIVDGKFKKFLEYVTLTGTFKSRVFANMPLHKFLHRLEFSHHSASIHEDITEANSYSLQCDGQSPVCRACENVYNTKNDCHYDLDMDMRRKGALKQEIRNLKVTVASQKEIFDFLCTAPSVEVNDLVAYLRSAPKQENWTLADIKANIAQFAPSSEFRLMCAKESANQSYSSRCVPHGRCSHLS